MEWVFAAREPPDTQRTRKTAAIGSYGYINSSDATILSTPSRMHGASSAFLMLLTAPRLASPIARAVAGDGQVAAEAAQRGRQDRGRRGSGG
jgi:hypothetical protein